MASHLNNEGINYKKRVECPEHSRGTLVCGKPYMYYVYMIKNFSNQLYVGITKSLEDRLDYHNKKRGALFTQSGNYKIVFHEEYFNLADARKREIQIKKWRRDKKELLIKKFNQGLPTKFQ
jgi:putative endonuclease